MSISKRSTMNNPQKIVTTTVLAGLLGLCASLPAQASLIWGNSAGSNAIDAFDSNTGVSVHHFTPGTGNGRGVVVVGNTVYYTVTTDPHIYELNATTGAAIGSVLTTQTSLSTISFDGTRFWLADYSGTNQAYRVNLNGSLDTTINLANATGNTDGLEYFNGKLIANRSDGCCTNPTHYDIYNLDGSISAPDFIVTPNSSTGIAFDGTNFITSDVYANSIQVWNGSTGAFIKTVVIGVPTLIEDLSYDFANRSDTCGQPGQPSCDGGTVPEPASLALLGIGLAGLAAARRRKQMARSVGLTNSSTAASAAVFLATAS